MKKYTKEQLDAYVGRKFVICKTKYGALDGKIGTVKNVEMMETLQGDVPMLVVTIPNEVFSPAIMMPNNFASEVK